jgi:hypothetical protein
MIEREIRRAIHVGMLAGFIIGCVFMWGVMR